MKADDIIEMIKTSDKKTPVKAYVNLNDHVVFDGCKVFGVYPSLVVFGEWRDLKTIIKNNEDRIEDIVIECDRRNSALPLLDIKDIDARIEPGCTIREMAEIGKNAVVMMGAQINIGAVIGDGTMIDMGAIVGGRAIVGRNCHIGAGAVLAGVIEPPSATPVIIEDDVVIGANAVVLEGIKVGKGAVIAAGAVVINDIPENAVAAGVPARVIKTKDSGTMHKTELVQALRILK